MSRARNKAPFWHGFCHKNRGIKSLVRDEVSFVGRANTKHTKKHIKTLYKIMQNPVDIRELQERVERESSFVDALTLGMNQVIVGQKHLVESLLIGLLSERVCLSVY